MKPIVPLLIAFVLAGCAAPAIAPMGEPASTVTVRGPLAVSAADGFRLLAAPGDVVTANSLENLARIEVWLKRGDLDFAPVGDGLAGTARTVTLANLRKDTTYQVMLRGFKLDPNTQETTASFQMSDDAKSTVTFDTRPVGGVYAAVKDVEFSLWLRDYAFAGEAGSGILIVPGPSGETEEPEGLARKARASP